MKFKPMLLEVEAFYYEGIHMFESSYKNVPDWFIQELLSDNKYKLEYKLGKPSKLTRLSNQSYVEILPGCYFMLDEIDQVREIKADDFERFYHLLTEDKLTNTFVERLEAMLDTFENKKDSMSNKELQQFALNLLKTSIMREKAHDSADKLLASITGES